MHDGTGEQKNIEITCNSMQRDKGHVNTRPLIMRGTSTSEGGPALEIHVTFPQPVGIIAILADVLS